MNYPKYIYHSHITDLIFISSMNRYSYEKDYILKILKINTKDFIAGVTKRKKPMFSNPLVGLQKKTMA